MKGALSWPFLRLYGLTLLYFSANSILNVIIPLKGESLGATNTAIGIVMGAYLFTAMLFRPWAGQIIYKYGPVRVLRLLLLVNGAALVLYTVTGMEGYFVARTLQGVCTAFFSMALQLGIMDALPDEDRSQGISMYSLCASMPGIFGPLLALGIWQAGNGPQFTMAMIAIALVTAFMGYRATKGTLNAEPGGSSPKKGAETLRSFSQLAKNPHLLKCSVLMLTASLVFGAVTAFIPLYASQIPHGNAAVYLMIQAGIVVLARFVLRKKIPSDGKWHPAFILTIILSLASAALCVSLSVSGGPAVFYTGAVLMGAAQALLYPALTTYLSFVLPQSERNVLIGLFIAMADLGVSLGGVAMGPVADHYSYSVMYMVCAVLSLLTVSVIFDRRLFSLIRKR